MLSVVKISFDLLLSLRMGRTEPNACSLTRFQEEEAMFRLLYILCY